MRILATKCAISREGVQVRPTYQSGRCILPSSQPIPSATIAAV